GREGGRPGGDDRGAAGRLRAAAGPGGRGSAGAGPARRAGRGDGRRPDRGGGRPAGLPEGDAGRRDRRRGPRRPGRGGGADERTGGGEGEPHAGDDSGGVCRRGGRGDAGPRGTLARPTADRGGRFRGAQGEVTVVGRAEPSRPDGSLAPTGRWAIAQAVRPGFTVPPLRGSASHSLVYPGLAPWAIISAPRWGGKRRVSMA